MKFLLLTSFFLFSGITFAQTDWECWEKADIVFADYSQRGNSEVKKNESLPKILSLLKDSYSFFISDLDGDNCPFYPTCSAFYVKSISETNIVQATLMFADRFTRDTNIFKFHNHYPIYGNGKFYDPINNYRLNDSLIIYFPKNQFVGQ